jgi:rRNA-processing protein CGR1
MVKKTTKKAGEPKEQRGIAKSGKFWKIPKEKFRKIQNSLPKKTLSDRLKFRDEIKKIKELSKSIKDDKKQVSSSRIL